jgi:hypothetical protein
MSSPDPSQPQSPSPATNTKPTCPDQGKFTKSQKAFLDAHLPTYFAIDDKKKGAKKSWILSTVFPLYVKEFNTDAPDGCYETVLSEVNRRAECRR